MPVKLNIYRQKGHRMHMILKKGSLRPCKPNFCKNSPRCKRKLWLIISNRSMHWRNNWRKLSMRHCSNLEWCKNSISMKNVCNWSRNFTRKRCHRLEESMQKEKSTCKNESSNLKIRKMSCSPRLKSRLQRRKSESVKSFNSKLSGLSGKKSMKWGNRYRLMSPVKCSFSYRSSKLLATSTCKSRCRWSWRQIRQVRTKVSTRQ